MSNACGDYESKTCRDCGITQREIDQRKADGERIWNYVLCGQCRDCRVKQDNAYDFDHAKREGYVARDDSIMCPYCGDVIYDDLYDYHNDDAYRCEECGKVSTLCVEYTVHFTTTKVDNDDDDNIDNQ